MQHLITTTSLLLTAGLCGQEQPETTASKTAPTGGIAWFGTWEQGLAEAKRTKRPILLISAAPHCRSVSGMW